MDAPMNDESAVDEPSSAAENAGDAQAPGPSPRARLARLALFQWGIVLVSLCLFAAADSWQATSGLGMATVLGIATAAVAGVVMTTVIHEWFHLLGGRLWNGSFDIPHKMGLFVYDWHFDRNSVSQFYAMSIAGTVGGALSLYILWQGVPVDTWARAMLRAAAVGAFVYASIIEWPVLWRTHQSREPLQEMMKIDAGVLRKATVGSVVAGFIALGCFIS